jgi:PTH1 family peptidyl-tRNA hydrolase
MNSDQKNKILAIIGLGNPGPKFAFTRHNIGFMVVDYLAHQAESSWHERDNLAHTTIQINHQEIVLVKPLMFMNSSGVVIPWLSQKGIKIPELLVIHDELEHPFGKVSYRCGGSARGHNGLRSLIQQAGPDFCRIRCGIGRPERKEDVSAYVLSNFSEPEAEVDAMIAQAAQLINQVLTQKQEEIS